MEEWRSEGVEEWSDDGKVASNQQSPREERFVWAPGEVEGGEVTLQQHCPTLSLLPLQLRGAVPVGHIIPACTSLTSSHLRTFNKNMTFI